jgi:predicted nucleotidyltransferase
MVEWLFPRTRWLILQEFFSRPDRELHVSELIRMAGGGSAAVQRELRQFTESGLLIRTRVGNQVRYRANPDHALFPELRSLVLKTVGLIDVLRDEVEKLPGVEVAFVHGSIAKGEDRADSDIDLVVIGRTSLRKLVGLLTPAQEKLRREINSTLYRPAEFSEKLAARNHFLQQVMKGPKLFVVGGESDLQRLAE